MIHDTIYSIAVKQDYTSRYSRLLLPITHINTGTKPAGRKTAPYEGSIGTDLEIGFIKKTTVP